MAESKAHVYNTVQAVATVLSLLLSALSYFQVGPNELLAFLNSFSFLIYAVAVALVILGAWRIAVHICRKKQIRSKTKCTDEDFQYAFSKCPYWIKVFLKTLLVKETAYSDANDFYFENYADFLLQFVDYKTVGRNTRQYSLLPHARHYFITNHQLLDDVTEDEVCRHARKPDDYVLAHMSTEFYWWYYSEEDHIDSNPLDLMSLGMR